MASEEQELQSRVISLCKELGLLVFHSGDARRDTGAGFPDLVIVSRDGCGVIFAELKSWNGTLSERQMEWKWALISCDQTWRMWRPGDLDKIEAELRLIA